MYMVRRDVEKRYRFQIHVQIMYRCTNVNHVIEIQLCVEGEKLYGT